MTKTLNMFQWNEEDTEGFGDIEVGTIGDYNEVDISDERARKLTDYIQSALDEGNHISFSIYNEDPNKKEREREIDDKRELALALYGDPDLWDEV